MKITILLILFLAFQPVCSQDRIFCLTQGEENIIKVKWLFDHPFSNSGFDIYRKMQSDSAWKKINIRPIHRGDYIIPKSEFIKDPALIEFAEAAGSQDPEGILLLAILLKSFQNDHFARFIGIRFDDTTAIPGNRYSYKVINLDKNETEISSLVTCGKTEMFSPPEELRIKPGKNSVTFKWKEDPFKFYGVNVYMSRDGINEWKKINPEPLLVSKRSDGGKYNYPDAYFIHDSLPENEFIYYRISALNFFGIESEFSAPQKIYIKDKVPPQPVSEISKKVDGRNVFLNWKEPSIQGDHKGYDIYRSEYYDSCYIRINQAILHSGVNEFKDENLKFRKYFYKIESIDTAGNRSVSFPVMADVFDNEPPRKPTSLTVSSDTGKFMLSWKRNMEEDILGYLVYQTIDGNSGKYILVTPRPVPGNIFVHNQTAKLRNKCFYKIVAVDSAFNRSEYSESASSILPDVISPLPPFLSSLKISGEYLILNGIPPSDPDLKELFIYCKNLDDSLPPEKIAVLHGKELIYKQKSSKGNWEFSAIATDSAGNRSESSNVKRIKVRPDKMEKPYAEFTSVKFNRKRNETVLSWKGNSNKYIIYRSRGNQPLEPISGTVGENSFSDKTVSVGEIYSYQLRAYNEAGDIFRTELFTIRIEKTSD